MTNATPPPWGPKKGVDKPALLAVAVVIALVVAAIAVFGGNDSHKPHNAATTGPDADVSYAKLTCQQWLDWTQTHRDNASADFIRALKAFDQSAAFAHRFAVNISKDCDPVRTLRVAEVAGSLATLDTDDFPR